MPSVELLSAYARLRTEGRAEMERALGSVKRRAIDMQGALDKAAVAARRVMLVGAGVTGFALKMAANAEAAGSRFEIAFGRQSKVVEKWAANIEKQTGRAAITLKPFLADIGALVKPLGATSDEVAALSERIAGFTIDLQSYTDRAMEEVKTAMLSTIFAGESEPLRRLGVNVTAAKVDAELLAMGYQTAAKGATDLQKVTARLNIAMREQAPAIGNAAQTRNEANNQLEALRTQTHALFIELGNALLPTLVEILPELVSLAKKTAEFVKENKDAVVWTVKWGAALGGLLIVLPKVISGMVALSRAIKAVAAAEAMSGVAGLFGASAPGVGRRFLPGAIPKAGGSIGNSVSNYLGRGGAAAFPALTLGTTAINTRSAAGGVGAAARGAGFLGTGGAIAGGVAILATPLYMMYQALEKNTQEINKARREHEEARKAAAEAKRQEILAKYEKQQEQAFGAIQGRVARALQAMPEYEKPKPIKSVALVEAEMRSLERDHGNTMRRIAELEKRTDNPLALKFYQDRLDRINEALGEIYKPLDEYKQIEREKAEREAKMMGKRTGTFGEAFDRAQAGDRMNWIADQQDAMTKAVPEATREFIKTTAAGLQEVLQQQQTDAEAMALAKQRTRDLGEINDGVKLVAKGVAEIQPPGFGP